MYTKLCSTKLFSVVLREGRAHGGRGKTKKRRAGGEAHDGYGDVSGAASDGQPYRAASRSSCSALALRASRSDGRGALDGSCAAGAGADADADARALPLWLPALPALLSELGAEGGCCAWVDGGPATNSACCCR